MIKRIASILMIITIAISTFTAITDDYTTRTNDDYIVQANTIQTYSDDDDPYHG